ncbi:MAG: hypothetical protein GX885_09670 [Methanomicrobiales archaeon]|nr:hypothetical protein [Methanomicrobiales archaeon]
MLLRIYSQDMMHLEEADKLNQYLFKINPSIFRGLLLLHVQQLNRVPTWIRKDKVKKDKLDTLLDDYYERTSSALDMSKKEFNEYVPLLKMYIGNKDNMKLLLMEMQADEQMFKKQKVELTMPDKTRIEQSKKSHQCNSLDYFF